MFWPFRWSTSRGFSGETWPLVDIYLEDTSFISSCTNDISAGSVGWGTFYVNGTRLHIVCTWYSNIHRSSYKWCITRVDDPHRCGLSFLSRIFSLSSMCFLKGGLLQKGCKLPLESPLSKLPTFLFLFFPFSWIFTPETVADLDWFQVSYNGNHLQQGTAAGHGWAPEGERLTASSYGLGKA